MKRAAWLTITAVCGGCSYPSNDAQDWPVHGGTHLNQYYSPLDQINIETVAQLKPAWFVELDTTRGQEATPIVVGGVLYTTTAWSKVYAVDAKTGAVLWYHDPKVPGASSSHRATTRSKWPSTIRPACARAAS